MLNIEPEKNLTIKLTGSFQELQCPWFGILDARQPSFQAASACCVHLAVIGEQPQEAKRLIQQISIVIVE